ncbi:MAG: hypothetical protein D6B28_06970 [Gammaproteobacteria bacterium]|nr:MAG: hypothetical protein D6B28_06970 [Gammaproteobacteria bacterium]
MYKKLITAFLPLVLLAGSVQAGEKEELIKLRNTTAKLLQLLVQEGVISAERAKDMVAEAQEEAEKQAREEKAKQMAEPEPGEVRIQYVPQFVKDQIRQQVRAELREDVSNDVMGKAKQERWGVPGVTPEWINRIKLNGDVRLRAQSDVFADGNPDNIYIDYSKANEDNIASTLHNTTIDRHRLRARLRLGLKAKITNDFTANIRLATGSGDDPVSTNKTMGSYGNKYSILIDRAYLKFTDLDVNDYPWITLYGGRMKNPFLSSDLVWDSDLAFDGIAATYRYNLSGSDNLFDMDDRRKTLYMTAGFFPLDEVELSSDDDKWLFGLQLGGKYISENNRSIFELGLSYYDYENITGTRNELNSNIYDYTAPDFMQQGNTLFLIKDSADPDELYGLASDYNLLNVTGRLTFTHFAPTNVIVTADWVRNIGYDKQEIIDRTGGSVIVNGGGTATVDDITEEVDGYQLKLVVGWPQITQRYSWRVFGAYKHLERDAVLDAFTDSDFHLGGTNAKGFLIGGEYGVLDNVSIAARMLSTDEIQGAPFGVDVFQLDLNAKF